MLIALVFCVFILPAHAQSPYTPIRRELTVQEMIHQSAVKWGANERLLARTLKCESGLNPHAVGDNGTSFGIAQINAPSWPHITKAQMFDAGWSIEWAAMQFSKGNARLWTCYNVLYGKMASG